MRARPALLALFALSAGVGAPACGSSPSTTPAPDAGPLIFSREAFEATLPDAGEAPGDPRKSSQALPVATVVEPNALGEIVAQASKIHVPETPQRDPRDGGIESDTGLPADAKSRTPTHVDAARAAHVHVGSVIVESGVATPAVERAARAQLYWPLVQRCRDDSGAILPPEVIRLSFFVDRDGYIAPSTVVLEPKDAMYAAAARCMVRELGVIPFRLPAAARGLPQRVEIDLPSVD